MNKYIVLSAILLLTAAPFTAEAKKDVRFNEEHIAKLCETKDRPSVVVTIKKTDYKTAADASNAALNFEKSVAALLEVVKKGNFDIKDVGQQFVMTGYPQRGYAATGSVQYVPDDKAFADNFTNYMQRNGYDTVTTISKRASIDCPNASVKAR